MTQKVIIPGVGTVFFQDHVTPEQIQEAVETEILPQHSQNQPKQSLSDRIMGSPLTQAAQGFSNTVVNFPAQVLNAVLPKSMQLSTFQKPENAGSAYNIGQFGGNLATFAGGGELADTARAAGESLPMIGKYLSQLGGDTAKSTIARQAIGGGLYGAIPQSPDDNQTQNALIGAALGGLTGGISKGLGSLNPINRLKEGIAPDDLKSNLSVTAGTQTGLGDVLQSPSLKYLQENVISHIPFSGADLAQKNVADQLMDRGNGILNKYLGDSTPGQVNQKIVDALKDASKSSLKEKQNLYNQVNDLAKKSDFKLELSDFSDKAKDYKDLINDSVFLKYEPSDRKLFEKVSNFNNEEEKPVDLKEANILSGKLNSISKIYSKSPMADDRRLAGVYSDLGKTLKNNIKSEIENSGNTELMNAFEKAEKNYKNNFSQFLDNDIYEFTHGGRDPADLINYFIKTGSTNDKSEPIEKLMSKLSSSDQDLIKYSYLSRALRGSEDDRNADPRILKNLWSDNKLGQNQKKALMPNKKERQEMDDFSRLVGMNSKALNRMSNPETGQQLKTALGLAPIISGYTAGSQLGAPLGALGSVLGGLAGAATPIGLSQIANKALTSPEFRNKIGSYILNKQNSSGLSGKNAAIVNSISQALLKSFMQ